MRLDDHRPSRRHAFVLMAIVLCCTGALPEGQDARAEDRSPDRGVLAVLRRDGIMFPFASFRGRTWTAPWPGGVTSIELPINLESVPERWWGGWRPDEWRAWLTIGSHRPVKPVAPAQFGIHCGRRLGIRMDYRPAEPVPLLPTEPFPKDGIVATAGISIEPIEIVKPSVEQWGALAVELLEDFDRAEDREVSTASNTAGWRHPVERDKRHAAPVRIESWYRTAVEEGVVASYIEAVRSYPPGPEDNGCGLETLFSGWVYHEEGKLARRDLGARLTYCDRVNATYMLPFGRTRLHDRLYWIGQLSGHESEWYVVVWLDESRTRLVLEYFAGSQDSCR